MDQFSICPDCFIEDQAYFEDCKRGMQALWQQERAYPLHKPCEKHVKVSEAGALIIHNYERINALGGIR